MVSRPDKVLFPGAGITKEDLAEYYGRIAPTMLPYLRDRALSLHRYPDGIEGRSFYQKNAPDHFPGWIKTARVGKKEGGTVDHVVATNARTLVYLADQACITLHTPLSRVARPDHPDRMVFDLDPSGPGFAAVRAAARAVRGLMEEVGLEAFVMTSGSRGLHVWVPLSGASRFAAVRSFARESAKLLCRRHPGELTVEQRKAKRRGRVYLDTLRNAYGQTSVAPYAVRARPRAPVATPLDWDELGGRGMRADRYTIRNIFRRLARKEDPWKGLARRRRSLAKPRRCLDETTRRDS